MPQKHWDELWQRCGAPRIRLHRLRQVGGGFPAGWPVPPWDNWKVNRSSLAEAGMAASARAAWKASSPMMFRHRAGLVEIVTVQMRTECSPRSGVVGIGARRLTLQIDYAGFNPGQHQDVSIALVDEATGDTIGYASTSYDWPIEFQQSGCITVGMVLSSPLAEGVYYIDFFLGPNNTYHPELTFSFEF